MSKKSSNFVAVLEEKQHIGQLFDRIASTYDGLNHGLSLNIDRRWRRKTVSLMAPAKHVLDVAIGTADLTIEMLRQGKVEQVTGIDLSDQMMAIGQGKVERMKDLANEQVQFVHANAQAMPFEDASFDGVTCAFGCRNFSNLDEGLREMYRVLYDFYFTHVLPTIGRIVSRDKTAYTYLNKSVKSFCWGEAFAQHLHDAGFKEESFETLTFGIATIYTAIK